MIKTVNSSRFWEFISDNIVSLATIAGGVGVIIWQGIFTSGLDSVSLAILGLLSLLATSDLIERRRRLDKIQEHIIDIQENNERVGRILTQIRAVDVKPFNDYEKAIDYLCKKTKEAKKSIEQASIDERRSSFKKSHEQFKKVKTAVIKTGKVNYRYLFQAQADGRRIENVKNWLNHSGGKFIAAGFKTALQPSSLPSFTIFDREEVYIRPPYTSGRSAVYLSIRQPDIVELFVHWFDYLWNESQIVDPNRLAPEQLDKILKGLLSQDT